MSGTIASALRRWRQRWLQGEDLRLGVCLSDDRIAFATRTNPPKAECPFTIISYPLPEGVLVHGVIRNPRTLRQVVQFIRAHSFPMSERCALCLPSSLALVVSYKSLPHHPSLSESALTEWVRDQIPFPLTGEVLALFYRRQAHSEGDDGVIVAARASAISEYQHIFNGAGLDVDVITFPTLLREQECRGAKHGERGMMRASCTEDDLALQLADETPWNVGYSRVEVVCG